MEKKMEKMENYNTHTENSHTFNYLNRSKRRSFRNKKDMNLLTDDIISDKTELQKIMEKYRSNIDFGKQMDEYYLNNLISMEDQYISDIDAKSLQSLKDFYKDDEKALSVHRKNLEIRNKKNRRK